MSELVERKQQELTRFEDVAADRPDEPGWLRARREAAMAEFAERGFPHERRKEERYRFVNLNPVLSRPWLPAPSPAAGTVAGLDIDALDRSSGDEAAARLVFVDGVFQPELSATAEGDGLRAGSLAAAIADGDPIVEGRLIRAATRYKENPFLAVNAGFFRDGALVHAAADATVDGPVVLLYVTTGDAGDAGDDRAALPTTYPRTLIVAEDGSRLTVVEQYVGTADAPTLTNAATEVYVGARAELDQYRLELEGAGSRHLSATEVVHTGDGAEYRHHAISLGARFGRHDLNAVLDGEYLESTLNGLYVLNDRQVIDNHSRIEHLKPNSVSHELYKGVLDGHARGVFNGRIYVAPAAQKTDAFQSNPNLLMTNDVVANSNPELEIYADDVKCSHGATYGDLDRDALFYLRSRGFDPETAEELLIYAFASDITERVRPEGLRQRVHDELVARLAAGRAWAEDL